MVYELCLNKAIIKNFKYFVTGNVYMLKDIIIKVKRQTTDREKIHAAFITHNDQYPGYRKNSSKRNGERKQAMR